MFNKLTKEVIEVARDGIKTEENKHEFFGPGINLIGKCSNKNCKIVNEEQFFQKGITQVQINYEVFSSICIRCSQKIEPKNLTNILLYNCKFSVKAILKVGDDYKDADKPSRSTGAGVYITYKNEKELWEWYFLQFTAERLWSALKREETIWRAS